MYEIDFLPVGDGQDSGDAIAMRFTRPGTGTLAHVIIDAGYQDDGDALVDHVKRFYGVEAIDLAILTHPDGDHIGGMGEVVRGLQVDQLWLHDIGAHGGEELPAAAAVDDLITVAQERGTDVYEVFAGDSAFGGALTILGPSREYYDELVVEQVEGAPSPRIGKALVEAARGLFDRITDWLDFDEVPFAAKEVTPRNNSSMVTLLRADGHNLLFTADAGEPALDRAWDKAEDLVIAGDLHFMQVPHHGSRRNCSSALLDRLLGTTGQPKTKAAIVSVVGISEKHPSGRIINAFQRRGCDVVATAGDSKCYRHDSPQRDGWSPATPLGPMEEEDDDDDE